jgi:hypothetical protein
MKPDHSTGVVRQFETATAKVAFNDRVVWIASLMPKRQSAVLRGSIVIAGLYLPVCRRFLV